MKHLHFVQSLEPQEGGGLGKAALELHESFLESSTASWLVSTCRVPVESKGNHVFQYLRVAPQKAYFAPELVRKKSELIEMTDVIHGHGFYVGTNWLLGPEARKQRKPLVYHPHGMFEPWILQRSQYKKKIAHWLFEDANFRNAALWRALTFKEADQIRAQGITAPIVVVPNGINLDRFDSVPSSHLNGSKTVRKHRLLFLGRLHSKKGVPMLLKVWAQLTPFHKDWELIVAGPDEEGLLDSWKQEMGNATINNVSFPGTVTGDAKVQLLKSADLFILPSFSEGFSIAILEAMAARVPVLATTACNFPELASAGAGWQCEPEADSLKAALGLALVTSEQERKDRGEIGRKLVETNYNWPIITTKLLQACEHIRH